MNLQRAFMLVVAATMLWVLYTQWNQIAALEAEPDWPLLLAATVAAVGLFFADAFGWHLTLLALGQRLAVRDSLFVWLLSAMARYLPGGIWGYTSRAALASARGVPLPVTSVSLVVETLLLATSSLAVGLPALLLSAGNAPLELSTALAVFTLGAIALHPRALRLLSLLPGRLGRALAKAEVPTAGTMLRLYLYYAAFWLVFGGCFVGFCMALYPPAGNAALLVASSLPLAFFVGFVVVFVPGGLGLRESVIYLLLLPALPPAACTLIAIGSRLWLVVAESVALVLSAIAARRSGAFTPP